MAREYVHYPREEALERDVKSIAAIMRLREGEESFDVERCRALFVTTNVSLAKAAWAFYSGVAARGTISPCVTDRTLTVILWLKMPLKAPDLPRKRIIADCYAATQPNEGLFARYITEVDKLDRSSKDATALYYALRYSPEARSALMDATLGEVGEFTEGTIPEIVRHVREYMQGELRAQLASEQRLRLQTEQALRDAEQAREEAVQSAKAREIALQERLRADGRASAQAAAQQARDEMLMSMEHQEDVRRARIAATSKTWAHRIARMLALTSLAILLVAGLSSVAVSVASSHFVWAFIGPVIVATMAAVNQWSGKPVVAWIHKLELALEHKMHAWLLSMSGLNT